MLGCVGIVQFVLGLVTGGGPGLGSRGARAWARGGPGLGSRGPGLGLEGGPGLGSRGPWLGLGLEGPAPGLERTRAWARGGPGLGSDKKFLRRLRRKLFFGAFMRNFADFAKFNGFCKI